MEVVLKKDQFSTPDLRIYLGSVSWIYGWRDGSCLMLTISSFLGVRFAVSTGLEWEWRCQQPLDVTETASDWMWKTSVVLVR